MGVRLIILLALLVGVLYCLHLLVQDYQALTAGSRLLRLLFKRDIGAMNNSVSTLGPSVRWRMILQHDPIQCARYLYCVMGTTVNHTHVQRGFIHMLSLEPKSEDESSRDVFIQAFNFGETYRSQKQCSNLYPYCPFDDRLMLELIQYLLHQRE